MAVLDKTLDIAPDSAPSSVIAAAALTMTQNYTIHVVSTIAGTGPLPHSAGLRRLHTLLHNFKNTSAREIPSDTSFKQRQAL